MYNTHPCTPTHFKVHRTLDQTYMPTARTGNIARLSPRAFYSKVFVSGLSRQPLCHLFTSWMCTAHTHIHTHPPFSQHTARTQTPMPQTHSRAHKHACLFHFPWEHDSTYLDLVTLRPAHAPICVHLGTHTLSLPWAFTRLGQCTHRLAEQGAFPTFLLSLTCGTCPVYSSLHSALTGLNARVSWHRAQSSGPAAIVLRK